MSSLKRWGCVSLLSIAWICVAVAQSAEPSCPNCLEWNRPQSPFRIYGNTYYVGPHGLSSILITSNAGHVLIDGGLAESAQQIAANVRSLGFRIEDVKLILNSHVHFDHAGGIAELQRMSGARVVASKWSAAVLKTGGVGRADPQYGVQVGIAPVKHVRELRDGETLRVGGIVMTPHSTPGHTPGGTSWTWKSCEGSVCQNIRGQHHSDLGGWLQVQQESRVSASRRRLSKKLRFSGGDPVRCSGHDTSGNLRIVGSA